MGYWPGEAPLLGNRIPAELAAPQGEPYWFIAGLAGEIRMRRWGQTPFDASMGAKFAIGSAMSEGRYRLIGSTASPYAIKLRALMRYRRIAFDWVIMTKALRKQTGHLRPNLIPVLQ